MTDKTNIPPFTHLHTRSVYSLSEALSTPAEICAFAHLAGYASVALTDTNGTFGFMEFHKEARELGISLEPAVVIRKGSTKGLRFFGVPEGYEFSAFLDAIARLSRDAPGLSARTVGALADLRVPIEFKVFTTPS